MMPRLNTPNRTMRTLLVCLTLFGSILSLITIGTAGTGVAADAPKRTASPNGLVINEIYDSQNPANEYFELYNTGAVPINLSTYVIYNKDDETPLSLLAPDNQIIDAGAFKVIGPSQLGRSTIVGTGLGRIDFLGLVNTSPSDAIIDVVNYNGTPNPNSHNFQRFSPYFFTTAPTLPEDGPKSIQRYPDGLDTNQGSDFALLPTSAGTASCADPFEPDDSAATASGQAVGTSSLHRLCPAGDQDWISLQLSTGFTYTLQTGAQGARVDTVLRLYDNSGNLLSTDNNPGSRSSLIRFQPTTSGAFKVQITDANNAGDRGADFLYTFTVTSTSAATATPATPVTATPIACQDVFEPDNNMATARPIDLNSEQVRTLCPVGDEDWVVFTASANKIYSMYTRDLAGPVDTVITLYDAQGNFLAENDDYQPGQSLASRIDFTFAHTSNYYLRVRDKRGSGGSGYQYTLGLSSTGGLPPTGTATVTPTLNPSTMTPTPGLCTDAYEPDGVPASAKLILIGAVQRHTICPATDADWVRFYARAGKVYTIRTGNLGVGLDTYMYLFDSDGQKILAQNDDGGDGSVASRIDFYPQRDDYYFAQVKNAGDIGNPDETYDLSLVVVPGAPQPPSTATGIAPQPQQTSPPVPTTVVQPTRTPVPSPTQGAIKPTPIAQGITPSVPGPVGTQGASTVAPRATSTEEATPTEVLVMPGVTPPGVPNTGAPDLPAQVDASPLNSAQPPVQPRPALTYAPMLFRLYYDRNKNDAYEPGEGIRGVRVYFVGSDGILSPSASLVTPDNGSGSLNIPVNSEERIYIPYLGIAIKLSNFPQRATHSLWLPPVQLPDRVP